MTWPFDISFRLLLFLFFYHDCGSVVGNLWFGQAFFYLHSVHFDIASLLKVTSFSSFGRSLRCAPFMIVTFVSQMTHLMNLCRFLSSNYRFSPTRTPSPWDGIRKSDKFSAVCPQRLPNIQNEHEALKKMPKGRLEYLKRLLPFLQNQSEDCLYLNVFSPLHGKPTNFASFFYFYFNGFVPSPLHLLIRTNKFHFPFTFQRLFKRRNYRSLSSFTASHSSGIRGILMMVPCWLAMVI